MAPVALTRRASLAALANLVMPHRSHSAHAADRPDILMFVTDDMRESDWSVLGPTRDLIEGTWIADFRYPTPQCGPARASLFTGKYAHNTGVRENAQGWAEFASQNDHTIFTALSSAGYHTAYVGKLLNRYRQGTPIPGIDDNRAVTHQPGYAIHGQYSTDAFRDQARAVIASAPAAKPLFLTIGFNAPHGPATPARRHRRQPVGGAVSADDRRRRRTLLAVNEAIAAIAAELGPERWANAAVLMFSDHGYLFPEDGRRNVQGKGFWYPEITRVPAIFRVPGAAIDGTRLSAIIDIAPTLLDIAGVTPDWEIDGRSLLASGWQRMMIVASGEARRQREGWANLPFAALLGPDRTYVDYRFKRRRKRKSRRGKRIRHLGYFADPAQRQNSWPDLPRPQQQALATLLAEFSVCAGDTCRDLDQRPWPA